MQASTGFQATKDFGGAFGTSSPTKAEQAPQVRHSNVSEDFRVTYTEFDALPNYGPGVVLEDVFGHIVASFRSQDWLDHFNAVDNLRIIAKYNRSNINLIFEAFGDFVLQATNSPKTCVVKNILAFLNECFQAAREANLLPQISTRLIPMLLARASGSSSVIRPLAEVALRSLSQNCVSDETLRALCQETANRRAGVSRLAFYYLTLALDFLRHLVTRVQPETLRFLFISFATVLEGPCADNKQICRRVVDFICHLMEPAKFQAFVHMLYENGSINNRGAELLMTAAENKVKVRPSIAAELQAGRRNGSIRSVSYSEQFISINGRLCC